MDIVLMTLGVLIVAVGIILSIALHEVGHLVPAKLFGVRVTQYMVGFGPTVWSKRRGETEYGVKAIPLGGYVAMIGMYPPPDQDQDQNQDQDPVPGQTDAAPEDETPDEWPQDPYLRRVGAQYAAPPSQQDPDGSEGAGRPIVRSQSTGLFQQMSADAREVAAEELRPGDEDRMFHRLATWKKTVVMLGGPFMNLLIALGLTAGTITLHGTAQATTTVEEVYECVVTVEAQQAGQQECTEDDPPGPAYEAGLRPGDEVLAFGGQDVDDWEHLTAMIRDSAGESREIVYTRDGERRTAELTPLLTERPVTDGLGRAETASDGSLVTEPVGFIGMGAAQDLVRQPPWEAVPLVWEQSKAVGEIVVQLPVRMYDVAVTTFTGQERDPDGPMSVVGVGRIAGELSVQDQIPLESRFATLISMVASVNVALMVFNLIPLLPLDGGHVAGALYESLRRRLAKLLGRPDPGPFDISKMLPVTYVVAALLIGMGVMLIVADVVNPIRLFE